MKTFMLLMLCCLFSLSLYGATFHSLIPCDGHLDIQKYPMLETERTMEMVETWTKNLDKYFQNPTINAEVFAKSTLMPTELPTVLTMLEKIQTRNLRQELKDGLMAQMEEVNTKHKDIVAELYPQWYDKTLSQLEEKLTKIKNSGELTYYDLTYSAKEFSALIDPQQYVGNFGYEVQMHLNGLNGAAFNADKFLEYYSKRTVPNNLANVHHFPFFVSIPTFENLGFKAMNKMNGIPVFYVGIIEKAMVVDGQKMSPGYFHFHDYSHIDALVQQINKKLFGWEGQQAHSFSAGRASVSLEQYQEVMKKMMSANETYGRYTKIINNRETYTGFERVMGEGLFFYLTHEGMMVNDFLTPAQLKNFFTQFVSDGGPDFNIFLNRINDQRDLGQAFKETANPRTAEDLKKFLTKVIEEL